MWVDIREDICLGAVGGGGGGGGDGVVEASGKEKGVRQAHLMNGS